MGRRVGKDFSGAWRTQSIPTHYYGTELRDPMITISENLAWTLNDISYDGHGVCNKYASRAFLLLQPRLIFPFCLLP